MPSASCLSDAALPGNVVSTELRKKQPMHIRSCTSPALSTWVCAQGHNAIYVAEEYGCVEALQMMCNQSVLQNGVSETLANAFPRGASSIEASVRWLSKRLSPVGSLQ